MLEPHRNATKWCSRSSPSAFLKSAPRLGAGIREACGYFRRPQKPLFERIEYPKSRSIRLFWTLNRPPVTTFAPVRAGKAEKCDPCEPARANRTPRGLREYRFSAPAPLPLEYFTRLFLEYTVLLEPFFLSIPARRTLGSADSRGLRPLPPTPENAL